MRKLIFALVVLCGSVVGAAESQDKPMPPAAVLAVTQCGKPVVQWVLLVNGHIVRIDKAHAPATAAENAKLQAWIATGHNDTYELPCKEK